MTFLLSVLLWSAPASASDAVYAFVEEAHDAASQDAQWVAPTGPRREALTESMVSVLRIASTCAPDAVERVDRSLGQAGFRLVKRSVGDTDLLVVQERSPQGGGLYVVRCGEANNLVLQAPHAFYDLQTDALAASAFAFTDARAVMFNTVHRYRAMPGEERADAVQPGDVAHQPASLFHGVTVAWAVAAPSLRFVQVHGFGSGRAAGDVVLSTGRDDLAPKRLGASLRALLPQHRVLVWGVDADTLGATTNVQIRRLNAQAPPRVLHVELSRELRRSWADAPQIWVQIVKQVEANPWGS